MSRTLRSLWRRRGGYPIQAVAAKQRFKVAECCECNGVDWAVLRQLPLATGVWP